MFATADKEDRFHKVALKHMEKLGLESSYFLGAFSLFEFDVVMKSRGLTNEQRMNQYSSLMKEFRKFPRES
ncbi:MAG: hypothetical protein ACYCQJ_01955 [Nitrososphaerales archaeon]